MDIKTKRAETEIQSLTKFQPHNSIQKISSAKWFKKKNYKPKYTMIQTFH